ncbi:hypothetical protein LEMA_P122950.1 [Plenodomus lingam JN3]|uniref:Uncharacterized protein n=1 Tax=Leptosphaeria maculans (strain JN3 / isolate v23.1.3 / race Av1-4-5-6-7-8) TaxID=985895 RepID=E4ZSD6_LEPMJ|nr:hypothetical protein LEMA_P122950.1 [Plenodomus lingam JN3]CBX94316.1 hypothetical protein LEMA_P122950.1 [Plenodomus lingam JN3]
MRGSIPSAVPPVPFALTQSHDADCWQHNDEFDSIIVGGSTAGLVLATRLSEALPRHCIAVMESGSDGCNESKIYIPGLRGFAFGYTYDWSLPMVPQLHMWPGLYRSLLLRIYRHTSKLAFLT